MVVYATQDSIWAVYHEVLRRQIRRHDLEEAERRRQETKRAIDQNERMARVLEEKTELERKRDVLLRDYVRVADVLVQRGCPETIVRETLAEAFSEDISKFEVIRLHQDDEDDEEDATQADDESPQEDGSEDLSTPDHAARGPRLAAVPQVQAPEAVPSTPDDEADQAPGE